ncbi:MAG: M20 family metallo-hydrolase [Roseovarius sp.]|nr:M20 family metallo-hydrolase [Roseovarius sp.]
MNWGEKAQKRLSEIAQCSLDGPGVTRLPFTPEHRKASEQISQWMKSAGLNVSMDAAGTLIGRSDGNGPALLMGSHQDSVRHAGRYDGIMGVALSCLAVEQLRKSDQLPHFPIEVLAFADEEGVRFPTALLGPRALAGTVEAGIIDMMDKDGISIGQALREFGCEPEGIMNCRRCPKDVRAYLEVHIEQGPVLQNEGLALGTVTGICGIERNQISFRGQTGHPGTVPMESRRDALVSAATFIKSVNQDVPNALRATVGSLQVHPNVVNAIPDRVDLTLEIRALLDDDRAAFANMARDIGETIAKKHNTPFNMERTYVQSAVPCANWLLEKIAAATLLHQDRGIRLPSGATHDASAMSDLCDIGMLFVRCKDGLSHRPDEYASSEDMGKAINVIADCIASID